MAMPVRGEPAQTHGECAANARVHALRYMHAHAARRACMCSVAAYGKIKANRCVQQNEMVCSRHVVWYTDDGEVAINEAEE